MGTPIQRPLSEFPERLACRVPWSGDLAELLGVAGEGFVLDPSRSQGALVVGSAVVRAAHSVLRREDVRARGAAALAAIEDWCHDVDGLPAGAVIAAGSRLDAARLVLHYGLSDAILVGAATVAAEGLAGNGRPAWHWHPETPLAFAALAGMRERLAAGVAETRRLWQDRGLLSARRRPALVVITRALSDEPPAWLAAPALALHDAWVLTSRDGRTRMGQWARDSDLAGRLLPQTLDASGDGPAERIDLAAVPGLLRSHLDVRIAGHDGGHETLAAFAAAGALHQMHLTCIGAPPISASHPGRRTRRWFTAPPDLDGRLLALSESGDEDAWLLQLDARAGGWP